MLAMGGQGGGVLADWIVALAEAQGWIAQSTSVPGVAQRTGATIYYIEMLPPQDGRAPVLSLMPAPGDVDVVIGAELMEAGRADPARAGDAGPDDADRLDPPLLCGRREEEPGDGIGDPSKVVEARRCRARSASSPSTWRARRSRTAA